MKVPLNQIASCFEGAIPSVIATCGADGVPNITYLSIVHFIDKDHVGLSFQFFNKTKRNIAENPVVELLLSHPLTGINYRLQGHYESSETSGPLFDKVNNKLQSVTAFTGSPGVFKLAGVDIYHVLTCDGVTEHTVQPLAEHDEHLLESVSDVSQAISSQDQLEMVIDTTLNALDKHLGYHYSMLLLPDDNDHLYTIASHGYSTPGVGAEVRIGEGVIGMAAQKREPIRINQMTRERLMGKAVTQRCEETGGGYTYAKQIPLQGLSDVESLLAMPVVVRGQLIGVLYVESEQPLYFLAQDEEALRIIANHLGTAMLLCNDEPDTASPDKPPIHISNEDKQTRLVVKHYEADQSIFLGHDYLIKGVAGAVLWLLLDDYVNQGRTEFTNRELRANPRLKLPDVIDNLDARLILLKRRLDEHNEAIRIEKTGRGCFHLMVKGELELRNIAKH